MDTLAYLHLTEAYDAPANSELETTLDYSLFFQALNWTKCSSAASISLILCFITFFTLNLAASPSQALEKGNKSSEVTSLQKQLQAAGYFDGPVTGYYGTLTQQAVSKFQKTKGLAVNGIADEPTLKALNPETQTDFQPEAPAPQSSEKSKESTQQALNPEALTDSQLEVLPSQSSEKSKLETNSTPTLKKGSKNSEVTALQKQLQAAGYFDGPVTGYFGTLTQEAVIAFQKARGITPNGVADTNTFNALNTTETPAQEQVKETAKPAPQPAKEIPTPAPQIQQPVVVDKPKTAAKTTQVLEKGKRGSEVTALQKKLQAAGYFDGPVTGYYGTLTQEAIIAFQKANGIVPDGVADSSTLQALDSPKEASKPSQEEIPKQEIIGDSQLKIKGDVKISPLTTPTPQKAAPVVENTPEIIAPSAQDQTEKASPLQTQMKLKKTISGKISPKSIVHSGNGLFFAQNMMYSHTITVYDRNHNLVKTIPDAVNLPQYGHSKFKGNYKGAPVEAAFSHNGEYAWVSNYEMFGSGFNNPGSDDCSPAQRTDKSFLYRINTETLDIEKVIQVGSVPKFVAATPNNNLILVSNWCSWDLSVVDTDKNKEIKRIQLGRYPRGIVVNSASEKAYVAVMGSYDIASINLKNFSVDWLKNVGQAPRHLNIDPDDKYLYSTLNGEGAIAKIDLSTDKVVKKISTGSQPRSMVISDDGQLLFVVNYGSNTVSKVRTSDMKVLQTVNVNSSPIGITYDPQTREVWVACYSGSIMVFQN
jgi:YVTN family beta-propeller protein